MLFHLASRRDWDARTPDGYRPAGLATEGFVHLSSPDQLLRVAHQRFLGRSDLVILEIDPTALGSPVVWEDLYDADEDFPHVYGPIDAAAIVTSQPFPPDETGRFDWWTPGAGTSTTFGSMPRAERPNMSAYGVPEEMEGALDWSWAEQRLADTKNFWVVTVDPRMRPHAMPVWGVWWQDRFWFSCAPDAFKARNIAGNPHVVVMGEDTGNVVSIEGTAERVEGRRDVADLWAARYEQDPEKAVALADFMLSHAVFEVTPIRAYGLIESAELFSSSATRWVW